MTRSVDLLLAEIEQFMEANSLSATAFGELAMNDRHLVHRLRAGGSVMLDTADLIRVFMANYKRPRRARRGNASAAA